MDASDSSVCPAFECGFGTLVTEIEMCAVRLVDEQRSVPDEVFDLLRVGAEPVVRGRRQVHHLDLRVLLQGLLNLRGSDRHEDVELGVVIGLHVVDLGAGHEQTVVHGDVTVRLDQHVLLRQQLSPDVVAA